MRVAEQDIKGDDRGAGLAALVDAWAGEAVEEDDALPATAAQDGNQAPR